MKPAALKQRADYTYKHNLKSGRHGWLRLTPAYSVKVVDEMIAVCDRPMRIYDPFCGTGTTALCAVYQGHTGLTNDINPFLVWLTQAKTRCYSAEELAATRRAGDDVCAASLRPGASRADPPRIHNIERWWSCHALDGLCVLKAGIEASTEENSVQRTLLLIAFCRTLIGCSAASFGHQSMSFQDVGQLALPGTMDLTAAFSMDLSFVLNGAAENPSGEAYAHLGDSRHANTLLKGGVDRVITSPPYANRMSYIRELRPYMYWLGWLNGGREAGELDWQAIGGTWGIATSRLAEWKSENSEFHSPTLQTVMEHIAHADNRNGVLLAKYIHRYFDDVWEHFRGLIPVLNPGATLHYIVGNSTFYGTLLPVEQLYADILQTLGFQDITCRAIRKRNSKKELVEFEVAACWPTHPTIPLR